MKRYNFAPWIEMWVWSPDDEKSTWAYYCKACDVKGWNAYLRNAFDRAYTHMHSGDHYRALDALHGERVERAEETPTAEVALVSAKELLALKDELIQEQQKLIKEHEAKLGLVGDTLAEIGRVVEATYEAGVVRD